MKIIAGEFRGRSIQMPKGIRPTSDKVREAFFEILKGRIEGSNFLDLYCGSGAVGIEALSRGAKTITFVDNNFKCLSVLKKNLANLDILDLSIGIGKHKAPSRVLSRARIGQQPKGCLTGIHIYKKDAFSALEVFKESSMSFDIIFLDPPYYNDTARNTLIAISNYDILPRNAIIAAETYKKEVLPEEVGLLRRYRTCRYGDTKLEFFGYTNDHELLYITA